MLRYKYYDGSVVEGETTTDILWNLNGGWSHDPLLFYREILLKTDDVILSPTATADDIIDKMVQLKYLEVLQN